MGLYIRSKPNGVASLSSSNLHESERIFFTVWHPRQVDASWSQYCFPWYRRARKAALVSCIYL